MLKFVNSEALDGEVNANNITSKSVACLKVN